MSNLSESSGPEDARTSDELRRSLWDSAASGRWWEPDGRPTVPAEWIADLLICSETGDGRPVHRRGIHARGIDVAGKLDLEDCRVLHPLALEGVDISEGIGLADSHTRRIAVRRSTIGQIDAKGVEVVGDLDLTGSTVTGIDMPKGQVRGDMYLTSVAGDRFQCHGQVRLLGANIGGQLSCTGAKLTNPGGNTLNADGATITGDVFLQALDTETRFESEGEIRLLGANIGGQLSCDGAKLTNPDGDTLSTDGATITGGVFLRARDTQTRFESEGEIRLPGANIGGQLSCTGARLTNPDGNTLHADRATITGSVFLRARDSETRFESQGEIRLLGANIGGQLSCDGARLTNPDGNTLHADRATITSSLFLQALDTQTRFESEGEIRLIGANVGGQLSCIGAKLTNPDGNTLSTDGATINGDVFLRARDSETRFESEGEIRLLGTNIGGQLSCIGAKLTNPDGYTLQVDRATITGSLFLQSLDTQTRFESEGEIRLLGTNIGGQLSCIGAKLTNRDGYTLDTDGATITGHAFVSGTVGSISLASSTFRSSVWVTGEVDHLDLTGGRIGGVLSYGPIAPPRRARMAGATASELSDDIGMWPDDLDLRGFRYDSLSGTDESPGPRIAWIRKATQGSSSEGFHEQPYHQLMSVYRASGRDAWARQVGVAMEKDRTVQIATTAGPAFWHPLGSRVLRFFHRLWGLLTAYGYRPWIALLWLGLWMALAMGLFTWSAESAVMTAIDAPAGTTVTATDCDSAYPCFDGRLYAIDVMVPILDVQQERFWLADASAAGSVPYGRAIGGATTRWFSLSLNALGWILTTAFVAGVAGWASRD